MIFSARNFRKASWRILASALLVPCGVAVAQNRFAAPQSSQAIETAGITASADDAPSVERAARAAINVDRETPADSVFTANSLVLPDTQTKPFKPLRCDIDSLGRCIKDLLDDEVGMWTSPLRIRKKDALWLLPLGAALAATLTTDASVSAKVGFNPTRVRVSKDFSNVMEDGSIGVAAGLYLLGKITHSETARETGVLSLEAVIDATVAVEVIKLATNRLRPNIGAGNGPFWLDDADRFTSNASFPSGHSAIVWAVAHVISDETPGNTWLHIGVYLLATGTALTRVTAQEHFPSDVLVGSAVGYLVGGYVYRHHSDASGREGLPVMIFPFSDASTRSSGLALTLDPTTLHWKSPKELWSKMHGSNSLFRKSGD